MDRQTSDAAETQAAEILPFLPPGTKPQVVPDPETFDAMQNEAYVSAYIANIARAFCFYKVEVAAAR